MAVKQRVSGSVPPTTSRPSSAERRAAQIATVSTKHAELKREAADRRANRAEQQRPSRIHAAQIRNRKAPQRSLIAENLAR
jgi:hypothetical protein